MLPDQKIGAVAWLFCCLLAQAQPSEPHDYAHDISTAYPPGHPHAIKWTDCAQNVPFSTVGTGGSFNASTVDSMSLPPELLRGRLDVPMDYSKPFCNENRITLGLAAYRPTNSKGPLFFCPGELFSEEVLVFRYTRVS
jgi:hypothetical protein